MRRSPMLAAALAAATAIALAAPAYADTPSDQQFLDALNKAGISYHSPGDAIKEAKQVCAMLGDKKSAFDVVNELTKVNQGVSTSSAYAFTEIAAGAYCPKDLEGGKSK